MAKKKKTTKRTPRKAPRIRQQRYTDHPNPEGFLGVLPIAGHEIYVERMADLCDSHGTKCDGLYVGSQNLIILDTELAPDTEREVFLHELFHAMCDKYQTSLPLDLEEGIANPLGCGFAQALAAMLPEFPLKPW